MSEAEVKKREGILQARDFNFLGFQAKIAEQINSQLMALIPTPVTIISVRIFKEALLGV